MSEPSDEMIGVTVSGKEVEIPADLDRDPEVLMRATGFNPNFNELHQLREGEPAPYEPGDPYEEGDEFVIVAEDVTDGG